MTTAAAASSAPTHPTATFSNNNDMNGSLLELFQEVLVKPAQVVID